MSSKDYFSYVFLVSSWPVQWKICALPVYHFTREHVMRACFKVYFLCAMHTHHLGMCFLCSDVFFFNEVIVNGVG